MEKVRTVSDSKRDFYSYHTRPINSVYRRVVEELLVEMHLLSVNVDFRYDSIYALGVVTSFERFMQGYRPEQDKEAVFGSLCKATGSNSQQYRQDAESLLAAAKQISVDDLLSGLQSSGYYGQNRLVENLRSLAHSPKFKYSRLFAIGLYTLLTEAQPEIIKEKEKREQIFAQFSEALHLPPEKLQKDLELYRSNLDKMEQLLIVVEEALEAERKKRLQKEKDNKATDNSDSSGN